MYSAYLKREIELTVSYATGVGGKKIPIVYHSELENFITNEMRGKIFFDFPVIIPNSPGAVATCAMWDAVGKVVAVGEATEDTLISTVAKSYPTTIATERAFDRAAIRFLGLGYVYSNLEMPPDGPKNYNGNNLTDAPTNDPVPPEHQKETQTTQPTSAANNAKPVTPAEPAQAGVQPKPTSTVQSEAPATQNAAPIQNGGDVKITMGKYASNPMTVAEIYATSPEWLVGIVERITPKKPEMVQQYQAMKTYLDFKNHPYNRKVG